MAAESNLSRRERQIMDVLFERGEIAASEVHQQLLDPPSYTAVRTFLRILENKGLVEHRQEGKRYLYRTRRVPRVEGRSALERVLRVFFGGSLEQALAAHLSDPKVCPDDQELRRLRTLIDQFDETQRTSRHKRPKGRKP